eukprot:scaffold264042_cov31-Tisochrysis_lutea.AAC.2
MSSRYHTQIQCSAAQMRDKVTWQGAAVGRLALTQHSFAIAGAGAGILLVPMPGSSVSDRRTKQTSSIVRPAAAPSRAYFVSGRKWPGRSNSSSDTGTSSQAPSLDNNNFTSSA